MSIPRKKKVRTVNLKFFCDKANGEWGLAHEKTIELDESFNAFWTGQGLFHDVFEHSHEYEDPYFQGDYAMNVGGEIAAMGALWYYYETCGFCARLRSNYNSPDTILINSTLEMMEEAVREGYSNFGYALESNVPKQNETDCYDLEWIINEHFSKISKIETKGKDDDKERGEYYKSSITLEKLQNLYRYGYRMAQQLIPTNLYTNGNVLESFYKFWDDFCETNDSGLMGEIYREIVFDLYLDKDNLLHWIANINPILESNNKTIRFKGGPDYISPIRKLV